MPFASPLWTPVAEKTVDALHRRFFNEINPVGFVKYASRVKYCYAMWNVLRHIGIYFISFDALASNFTMTAGHYFTFASDFRWPEHRRIFHQDFVSINMCILAVDSVFRDQGHYERPWHEPLWAIGSEGFNDTYLRQMMLFHKWCRWRSWFRLHLTFFTGTVLC